MPAALRLKLPFLSASFLPCCPCPTPQVPGSPGLPASASWLLPSRCMSGESMFKKCRENVCPISAEYSLECLQAAKHKAV